DVDDRSATLCCCCCSRKRNHVGRQCLPLAHGLKIAYPNARGGGGIEYELLTMHHASHVVHAAVAGIAALAESAKRAKRQNRCNTDGGGSTERADRCHEGGGSPSCCRCGGCRYLRSRSRRRGSSCRSSSRANSCYLGGGGSSCHLPAQCQN